MTRKTPIESTRKVGRKAGRKIAHQSVTGDLSQHPLEAVADRKLDPRRRALFGRNEMIADFALGGRPAALVTADSDDPAGTFFKVALDACCTAEVSRNRPKFDADRALHPLGRRFTGQRCAGQAGRNLPDIAQHLEDLMWRI